MSDIDEGWRIDDYDDEDWYDDEDHDEPGEPDYHCGTCNDNGDIRGATGRIVNCPDCRPTPRQRRRQERHWAWEQRRAERQWSAWHQRGLSPFDDEAPF